MNSFLHLFLTLSLAGGFGVLMKQCFTQTPYHLTTQFRFEDDRVFVDEETNVAFGLTKRPQLVGRAE
jgi:hypothetical protein